ncbi:MAG: hypothetical protein ABH869_06815 [Candidatus Omnitrophota bacterium]
MIGKIKYAAVEQGAFNEHWLFRDAKLKTLHHLGNGTFTVPESNIIDLRVKE